MRRRLFTDHSIKYNISIHAPERGATYLTYKNYSVKKNVDKIKSYLVR